jgi:hypothetical protein
METTPAPAMMDLAMEFRRKYRLESYPSFPVRKLQRDLIIEEFKEFLQAEVDMQIIMPESREHCLKELVDLVYVCYQFAAVMGWDLDEALRIVHESNMSKLDDKGRPVLREDGKVMKGKNYKPPILAALS